MYLFFKLIKKLEPITISKADWDLLADVYQTINPKNLNLFIEEITKYTLINDDVINFMQHMFAINTELQHLNTFFYSELPENDRVLVLAGAISEDISSLTMAAKKIAWLTQVGYQHEETNTLFRLALQAISLRIKYKDDKTITLPISSDDVGLLISLTRKIHKDSMLKKLFFLCTEYQNSIATNMGLYLRARDQICYKYYTEALGMTNMHHIIRAENEAIEFDAPHAELTPMFMLLRTKYAMVSDLINILSNPKHDSNTRDESLLSFAACFIDYEKTFKKRFTTLGNWFFTLSNYTDEPLEDKFLAECASISAEINSAPRNLRTRIN